MADKAKQPCCLNGKESGGFLHLSGRFRDDWAAASEPSPANMGTQSAGRVLGGAIPSPKVACL